MRLPGHLALPFFAGFLLAILFILISPRPVLADHGVCPDNGKWGIHSGNSNHPGGLVVITQLESGQRVSGINFTIATVDTDGGGSDIAGYGIAEMDASGFNALSFNQSKTFTTGDTFWCGSNGDNYTGVTVLGFGTTASYGNRWVLWCLEVTGPSGSYVWNSEEFKITNVSAFGGQQGYWTGNVAGWDSGFHMVNGTTTRITLTWHETTPLPPPPPTDLTRTGLPSCSDTQYSGVQIQFYVSQATNAEYQLFADGALVWQTVSWSGLDPNFTNLLQSTWSNLNPNVNYTWQAKAGNSGVWSSWVSGPSWNVLTCPKPINLTVDYISTMDSAGQSKDIFLAGETVYVKVRVRNNGSDPVGEFWTKIYATTLDTTCGNNTQSAQFNVMSLAGLSTVTQTVSFTIPSTTPTGPYYAQAFTDATCWISESNEGDNTNFDSYWVSNPTGKPDLVVEFMGLHDGVNYKTIFSPGETVYATVRINNLGGNDSEPNPRTDVFREKLDGCNNTTYSQRLGTPFGIALFANGKTPASLTFTFTAPLAGGNYTAYAFVDSFTTKAGPPPYCDNNEEYENNNVRSAPYQVISPCPTFTLSNPSGNISDPTPHFTWSTTPSDSYQFEIQLRRRDSTFSSGYWSAPSPPTTQTFLSWPTSWQTTGIPDPENGPAPTNGLDPNVFYFWRVNVTNVASCFSSFENVIYVGPPWMMTKGGDMVIKGNISLAPPPGSLTTAEYAAIAKGDISKKDSSPFEANKISLRSWKLRNYSNLKTPPRSTYDYFWSLLSGSSAPSIETPASGSLLSSSCPATPPCVFRFSGTEFVWDSTATQTLPAPVVIFVGGDPNDGQESDFKIQKSLTLSLTSPGVIFIVEGNVLVHPDAQEMNGVFIVNKQFKSEYTAGANPDNQLKVKGSVIAHGGFSLTRDRGNLNTTADPANAAEFFEFQPRYLVEFREIIGAPLYSWTEVSP